MAWPLFLVQTKAATPFHPPPLWELQFRGDRFLLGSASRHLSLRRVGRMSPNICCVTATSANRNVTLRHRANFRLPRRDGRLLDQSVAGDVDRTHPIGLQRVDLSSPCPCCGFPSLVFPLGFRSGDALAGPLRAVSAGRARAQIETLLR